MRDRSWLFVAVLSAVSVVFICTACPNGITDNYPKGPDGSYDLIDDHDPGAGGTWFYIDPVSGSNENDGTSASAALQDFVRLSGRQFGPGDRILVKSGTTLYGTFVARGNGSSAEPVVITGYGGSAKPIVKMRSSDKTGFNLTNVQYWEIRNLEITSEPSDMKDDSNWRVAVLLYNNNGGVLNHLVVDNCYIHDIQTFQPGNGAFFTRFYGGIFVNSGPDPLAGQKPSRFNDVQITNNRVDDCTEAGIYFEAWPMPEVYPKGWYNWNDPGNSDGSHFTMWNTNMQGLTTNLIVSGNTVTRAGGDGMMVGWCDGALIEKNIVADACYNRFSAYAALWTANAHHSVIQYNEIYGTRFNADGMALDDDCFGGDNIYQYNYSHDNEGGFFMTMGQGNNVIVRYNISVNDGS
ncbi:MAG: right-handed parallel beta-helix repeat-containing protein, partial [Treponema sp.]|nr:right-handed parallel beta-helix repeat-containing protein [Treponema sp.]